MFKNASFSLAAPVEEIDYAGLIGKIGAQKGKVVVVNFWATWCQPCRMEIPDLIRTRNTYSEQNVVILGVSVDRQASRVMELSRILGINYTLLHARKDVPLGFGIRGIPRTLIYNRNGEKVIDHVGVVDFLGLSSEISKLLKE